MFNDYKELASELGVRQKALMSILKGIENGERIVVYYNDENDLFEVEYFVNGNIVRDRCTHYEILEYNEMLLEQGRYDAEYGESEPCSRCRGGGCVYCEPHRFV